MTVSPTARRDRFFYHSSAGSSADLVAVRLGQPLTRLSFCCTPPLLLVGVSIVTETERQLNNSLADG